MFKKIFSGLLAAALIIFAPAAIHGVDSAEYPPVNTITVSATAGYSDTDYVPCADTCAESPAHIGPRWIFKHNG